MGLVAMDSIEAHTDKLECYTCHATWAPQCYGCHVKVDYSKKNKNPDFLAASKAHHNGVTGDVKDLKKFLVDGKVTETRSYLRWENPALSRNGEGRISPTIPGCQVTLTVIGKDGKALLQNYIWDIPNVEGEKSVKSIVMSPVQPHTITKKGRSCESCHNDPKALGLGINGGKYFSDQSKATIVDLMTADKKVLPKQFVEQIPAINKLPFDYSAMIDENATQLQTVGDHWRLSHALDLKTIKKMDRRGVCLSCHQDIPKGNLAVSAMTHIAQMAGVQIDKKEHDSLLRKLLNIGAWGQILVPILILILLIWLLIRRKR
jgi:hypothetical protein